MKRTSNQHPLRFTSPAESTTSRTQTEWYEGFNEWKEQWKTKTLSSNCSFDGALFQKATPDHSSDPSRFLHYMDVIEQVEQFEKQPEDLLRQILNGIRIQRNQKCDHKTDGKEHGTFVRPGYRVGNWIAWAGHESCYSSIWTDDAGCQGCKAEHEEAWKDEPAAKRERFRQTLPIRQFDLKTPATCPDHGNFLVWATLAEYSDEYAKVCERKFRVDMHFNAGCPGCDAEWEDEEHTRERLDLSREQWERGGKQIMAAIDYAMQDVTQ